MPRGCNFAFRVVQRSRWVAPNGKAPVLKTGAPQGACRFESCTHRQSRKKHLCYHAHMKQETALKILQTGANVFLTGEPGSGKTHTVNQYVGWLRSRGIEPAITASTGIASTHIHGMTVHSWSGIGIRRDLSPYDLDKITQNKRGVGRVCYTNHFIFY